MVRLTALYLYPVKACRGLALPAAEVGPRGFVGDRRFLITDAGGTFLTQRVQPRMALIETALTPDSLILSAAGHADVRVPLQPGTQNPEPRTVTIWRDTVTAEDCGDEAGEWLSRFLGFPARLVRGGVAYRRPIADRKLPSNLGAHPPAGHEVSFADAFPFMLLGEESLADLNARLAAPLPMNRFRPSLVVAGAAPYAEDEWTQFRIGSVIFHGATPCGRCVVTTTDQATAERAKEPLRTLATYRTDAEGSVNFGRNLVHETKSGRLAVGDAVEVL